MTSDKLKIIKEKIKLAQTKEQIKLRAEARSEERAKEKLSKARAKAIDKFLKKPITYRKILKPSERIGIVLQVAKKEPTTIKNFIDSSLITGRSL